MKKIIVLSIVCLTLIAATATQARYTSPVTFIDSGQCGAFHHRLAAWPGLVQVWQVGENLNNLITPARVSVDGTYIIVCVDKGGEFQVVGE